MVVLNVKMVNVRENKTMRECDKSALRCDVGAT